LAKIAEEVLGEEMGPLLLLKQVILLL